MHPIERLRYVARSRGDDQRTLVEETALGLRSLGLDRAGFEHAGLVVACRRIVERHPATGALWWLAAHLLTSPDPMRAARELAADLDLDPTASVLADALPDDATVCVVGWPDTAGDALARRGDVRALVVDSGPHAEGLVRALRRGGGEADLVPAVATANAVAMSDLVVIEAQVAGATSVLAAAGSSAAAAVAYCAELPTWLVVARGRVLPDAMFDAAWTASRGRAVAWLSDHEVMPVALTHHLVQPVGVTQVADNTRLVAECPLAAELLRSSPM